MQALYSINKIIWGIPLLVLIMGCGIYFTFSTGFIQIRGFPRALAVFVQQLSAKNDTDGTSGYRALCTALSATVGTGNIAGVAGAIALGGPGAIFWMWVFAFLGMAIKFAEAVLAVYYRRRQLNGTFCGGPMYMIETGLGSRWKWLAVLYCFFGVTAAFGVGNATQINTVISSANSLISTSGGIDTMAVNLLLGTILAVFVGVSMFGGGRRIGAIAERLIPFACVGYILLCIVVIILRLQNINTAFASIFQGAFSPKAVTSGTLGSCYIALRIGASRGLFTNEAGMGTASIAHAGADVKHPVDQGFMGIMEVFLDTIVICTLTAVVILVSGVPIQYGSDPGVNLTVQAFSAVLGSWIKTPIAIFLCLFAVATVLGWGLYGMVCAQYLFGQGSTKWFIWLQIITVLISSVLKTQTVWLLAESVNGLMAVPNIITLIILGPNIKNLITDYYKKNPPAYRRGRG